MPLTGGAATAAEPAHGFAVLGTLKYPPGFAHFDYANPDAPKGGRVRLWYFGSYDNVNPFILKGKAAAGSNLFGVDGRALTFERLMQQAWDEPDSYYGLIAESVELPDDRQSITFTLRPQARWHDGSEITVADVIFSFDILRSDGHPAFRIQFQDVERAVALGPHRVRFDFAAGSQTRDLPAAIANMPVVSKRYYADRAFADTTMEPPLGSGPYQVERVDEGRSITYRRVEGHWGRDLGVYAGRWNFDRITYDYYRDRDIALEALFAGKIDFREDFTSRNWATKYDGVPAVEDGRLKRESVPDARPAGFQAFYLNSRRAKFQDRRVRQAFALLFDFEWTNRNLFYGAYKRTHSAFQNSDMEARGEPGAAELALLKPWRGQIPDEVFGPAYQAPRSDGSGNIRRQLRQASGLLREAGWQVRDGALRNDAGEPFEVEFLSYSRGFERIIMPYIRNLERAGIAARFRLVEPAQYQRRMQEFDYDVTTFRFGLLTQTPGLALRERWGSANANVPGSRNYTGLDSPAVDALIEAVIAARSRPQLVAATGALDRVLMASHHFVPQWYKASHNLAYWDMFGRPAAKPTYDLGFIDTWWVNAAKARALGRGG